MSKLLRLKMTTFNDKSFSEILDSIMFDITNVAQLADQSFFNLIMEMFKLVGGFIRLVLISWKLSIFILMFAAIKYVIIGIITTKKDKMFDMFLENVGKTGEWVGGMINGIQEIKLWNLYKKQEEIYSHLTKNKMDLDKKGCSF
ncbi:ABC transporter transmembrane domain-containing protein [Cellulosilyticum ruminicola]|uniref:ABC transporter transmembrane domain-containing protein n=1 Tax=Cellulosilyticum ruminicola TaxID=425254 RepID=UPI002714ABC0|nr:ABC transporter transmembrane domain-containing protein [Cellulosilyticum ruminicola]